MIFNYNVSTVTFFEEDQAYFEKRLTGLKKFLGNEGGDPDSVKVDVHLDKDKHHSGEKFHGTVHVVSPHGGNFHGTTDGENIKILADKLKDILEGQMAKFHKKHT